MRRLILVLLVVSTVLLMGVGIRPHNQGAGGAGIPGLSGTTGNGATLSYLYGLKQFAAVNSQVAATTWVDPLNGNDATGDGSYDSPYFSFRKIKQACLDKPNSACLVKGRDRVFTHTLLTVTYSGGIRHLLPGETVTFTDPAGTAEVLAVYGNKAAVTWLSGDDARSTNTTTNTTFSAGSGESTGTVTAVQDSINGERTWVIEAADINTGTDATISAVGHDFVDGDGPFRFYNSTTMPTFGTDGVAEDGEVWICNIVANTSFEMANESTCTDLLDFTSQGVGDNQIIFGSRISGTDPTPSTVQTIQGTNGCANTDGICTYFGPEFADSPWIIDGGRLYPNGADSNITNGFFWIGKCQDQFDTGGPPQTSGSPDLLCDIDGTDRGYYNTPVGGLFMLEPALTDPELNGWFGIQNGTIQNIAMDCLSAGAGGKMIALNVKCKGIRNGAGDRSQANEPQPADQAHNSALTAFGENTTDADLAASVIIWINGDGSWSEIGSDDRSAGYFNVTGNGVGYVISQGKMTYDGIVGDTCVGTTDTGATSPPTDNTHGGPCTSSMFVMPGGEMGILGTHLVFGGTTDGDANNRDPFMSWSGTGDDGDGRLQFFNTVIEARANNVAATQPNVQTIFGWSNGTGDSGKARSLIARNTTVVAPNGPHLFLGVCGLATGATMTVDMRGMILDGWASSSDYMISAACGTIADGLVPATVTFEGIWDQDDRALTSGCSTGPRFRLSSSSYCIGDEATVGTWMYEIVNTYGVPSGQWKWFVDNSADSGGLGVDDLQWTAGDPSFRCIDGKECWQDDTLAIQTNSVFSMRSVFGGGDTTCIPADVIGTQVCAFRLVAANGAGAR